jgi:hypothetical protein
MATSEKNERLKPHTHTHTHGGGQTENIFLFCRVTGSVL